MHLFATHPVPTPSPALELWCAPGLEPAQRANADTCAKHLTNKRAYLDYPTALKQWWPIATGIIEGACRHLVKDRMDLTPLGTTRRRNSPQTPGPTLQRRIRDLLALPPRSRTATHPPDPLRRLHRSEGRMTPLQKSRTNEFVMLQLSNRMDLPIVSTTLSYRPQPSLRGRRGSATFRRFQAEPARAPSLSAPWWRFVRPKPS